MLDGDVLQCHQSGNNASEWVNKQKSKKISLAITK